MVNRLLSPPFTLENQLSQQSRRLGVLAVVSWLQARAGDTWQERWLASGAERELDWRMLVDAPDGRTGPSATRPLGHLAPGLLVLICADVIRPSLAFLLASSATRRNLAPEMARTRDPDGFAALVRSVGSAASDCKAAQQALTRIACILAAKGRARRRGDRRGLRRTLGARPPDARRGRGACRQPAVLPTAARRRRARWRRARDAARSSPARGQPSCEQLIDRYQHRLPAGARRARRLPAERQPSVDFSSLQRFAYLLGKLFWADLEAHHPGIDSLKLPREVAAAWKQRVMTRGDESRRRRRPAAGRPQRANRGACLLPRHRRVGRGRPGPVGAVGGALPGQRERRLPQEGPLAAQVPHGPAHPRTPPGAAHPGRLGGGRTAPHRRAARRGRRRRRRRSYSAPAGETLRRPSMRTKTTGRIWAEEPDSGRRRDLSFEEHRGFWTWAMVEVLRHTGIRIEELTELSHHSLIQYRLPTTGELIPLLQITPSKTDAERLLVISPELADVLSAIVGRIRGADGRVPLVVSYDKNERIYNPPMPLLFQWRRRLENRPVSETSLRKYLDHALTAIGVKDADGRPMRYTFHDFRRMFITDAIMHGMPPHIAQLVAGHRDINTTMGYKAVYPEEVINGHRAFITRRRALRPCEEYRIPTDEEWAEFLGHFDRRKVAVGDCGRSYDTPCIHEHSCLRCPLLRPDPAGASSPRRDPRQPDRPHHRSRIERLARRGRRTAGEPRRRPRQARPDGPDRGTPDQRGQSRDADLLPGRRSNHAYDAWFPRRRTLIGGRQGAFGPGAAQFGEDTRDAEDLADLLRLGRLAEAWIAPPKVRELRELVRYRAKLVCLRTNCKLQVYAVLAKEGVNVPMTDLFGVSGTELLETCHLATAYRTRVESLRDLIEVFDHEITKLEGDLRHELRGQVGYQAIQQIPGVGPLFASVFVAEIGDVTRFRSPAQLASWAGLTPKHHESDLTVHRGPITKMACGRARLNGRLYDVPGGDYDDLGWHRHPSSPTHL